MSLGKDLLEKAKEFVAQNDAKAKSCPLPHKFSIPIDRLTKKDLPEKRMFCSWRCEVCGTIQDFSAKYWYELGLEHGKR